jgi:mono/diheme cytochrome c family protein
MRRLFYLFLFFIVACNAPQTSAPPTAQPLPSGELTHAPRAFDVIVKEIGPLPTDEASLLAGRRLYVESCVVCHAATGDGKGEYSLGADAPAVPDLRAHMAPGVHSDAHIAAWIANGVPGTSMPGYSMVLSEEQIRQLTAYLRTFGQANPLVGVDPAALATEQARPPTPTPIPDVAEGLPKLAFVRGDALWYSAGTGSPPQPLIASESNVLLQSPAFDPAGTQIAYLATRLPTGNQNAVTSELQLINSDGSARRTLWQSSSEQARSPFWQPDGTAILLTVVRSEAQPDGSYLPRSNVVRVEVASGATTPFRENGRDLVLSSDGQRVAYVRQTGEGVVTELVVADANGQNQQVLGAPAGSEELAAPRFAPDGRSLVVAVRGVFPSGRPANPLAWLEPPPALAHGSPWDIWAIDLASGSWQRLTALGEDEPHAAFSPAGDELMLLGVTGIYRLNRDGGKLRRVDPQGGYGGLDWAGR